MQIPSLVSPEDALRKISRAQHWVMELALCDWGASTVLSVYQVMWVRADADGGGPVTLGSHE